MSSSVEEGESVVAAAILNENNVTSSSKIYKCNDADNNNGVVNEKKHNDNDSCRQFNQQNNNNGIVVNAGSNYHPTTTTTRYFFDNRDSGRCRSDNESSYDDYNRGRRSRRGDGGRYDNRSYPRHRSYRSYRRYSSKSPSPSKGNSDGAQLFKCARNHIGSNGGKHSPDLPESWNNRRRNSMDKQDGYSSGAMSDSNFSRRSALSEDGHVSAGSGGAATSAEGHPQAHVGSDSRFPHAYFASSEGCKSDIATICSSSFVDEMELASVLSGEVNQQYNVTTASSTYPPTVGTPTNTGSANVSTTGGITKKGILSTSSFDGRRSAGGLEFPSRHVSMQEPPGIIINDMGPPLSRIIINASRPGSIPGSGPGSTGGGSFSTGGEVPSDVAVNVDTDDGASIAVEMDLVSVHSASHSYKSGFSNEDNRQSTANNTKCIEHHNVEPQSLEDANLEHNGGRMSPGGTVYKGRGVRRYMGRYMNLPLKRFQQTTSENEPLLSDGINRSRSRSRSRRRDRWRRSRSRSHSRENPI